MASLSEAYGCSFSDSAFEVIDDNFSLDSSQEIQQQSQQKQVQQVQKPQVPPFCIYCKKQREQLEHTNLMLIVIIGLLLFIIIEKRMK